MLIKNENWQSLWITWLKVSEEERGNRRLWEGGRRDIYGVYIYFWPFYIVVLKVKAKMNACGPE